MTKVNFYELITRDLGPNLEKEVMMLYDNFKSKVVIPSGEYTTKYPSQVDKALRKHFLFQAKNSKDNFTSKAKSVLKKHMSQRGPQRHLELVSVLSNIHLLQDEGMPKFAVSPIVPIQDEEIKTLNDIFDIYTTFLNMPEIAAPSQFQLEPSDISDSHLQKFLDIQNYKSSSRQGVYSTSNASTKVRVGDQTHKISTKLFLYPKNKLILKNVHLGIKGPYGKDKLDVVAPVSRNGIYKPLHIEMFVGNEAELKAKDGFDGMSFIERRAQACYKLAGFKGEEVKTYVDSGKTKLSGFMNEGLEFNDVNINDYVNLDVLKANPFLLGGTGLQLAVDFVNKHRYEFKEIYAELSQKK